MADLLKAVTTGQLWDVLEQLRGEDAAKLRQVKQLLLDVVPNKAESDPEKAESVPEKIVMSLHDSSGDSSSSSDWASDTDRQPDTEKKEDSSSHDGEARQLDQDDDDVIVLDEHTDDEANGEEDGSCTWATQAECVE